MADQQLDVLVICGSLRKGSYNAAMARTLPGLAPLIHTRHGLVSALSGLASGDRENG